MATPRHPARAQPGFIGVRFWVVNSTPRRLFVRELDTRTVFGPENGTDVEFAGSDVAPVEFTDGRGAGLPPRGRV